MGVWGYGPLDSDAALDVQHIWENYVQGAMDSYGWTEDDVVHYFVEKRWGVDAVQCGDNITNSEIIALLEIFRAKGLRVTDHLRRIAEGAINRELVKEELEAWQDPPQREAALLEMLDEIGGHVARPEDVSSYRDPPIEFANKTVAEQQLMKLTGFGKMLMFSFDIHNNHELQESLPTFIKTLNRFVHHGTWEKDSNVAIEAVSQRLMMVAYYLGMSLGYQDHQIRELINDAKWEKGPQPQ